MTKRNSLWRYLVNVNPGHLEVHDLQNETAACQIDEIVAAGHDRYITGANSEYELANWLRMNPAYDGCEHCLPGFHRK